MQIDLTLKKLKTHVCKDNRFWEKYFGTLNVNITITICNTYVFRFGLLVIPDISYQSKDKKVYITVEKATDVVLCDAIKQVIKPELNQTQHTVYQSSW